MYDVEHYPVKKIVKRDGRVVDFDPERIRNAIRKAMVATGRLDEQLLDRVTEYVLQLIAEKFGSEKIPHVEDVQDLVELTLVKFDLYEVAKAYILYRKERERIRKEKMRILEKEQPRRGRQEVLGQRAPSDGVEVPVEERGGEADRGPEADVPEDSVARRHT
jgi:ribonucleoside-diphosphate reductase alpha chain